MTAITYAYKVINTNPDLKVMEVEYTAEGYPTVLVGMPFPKEGVELDTFVAAYSPIYRWLESTAVAVEVPVGTSGILTHDSAPAPTVAITPDPTQLAAAQAAEQAAFEQKVADALLKLGVTVPTPAAV